MDSSKHEKLSPSQDQFHIISRSAQTNVLSIGFTLRRLISPAPFFDVLRVPEQKAVHSGARSPNSPKNIKVHSLIS